MTGKLLYKISGRFVKVDKIGRVPEGDRSNFHYRADVDGSEIKGKLSGIDYSVTNSDGVLNAHIFEVLTTNEEDKIFIERTGRSIPVEGDASAVFIRGEGKASTASPRLGWLNSNSITWEAHLRRDSLEFAAEVFA